MNRNLEDEVYKFEFRRTVLMFRHFYPSDINKMLVDIHPADRMVVPQGYSVLLRQNKIEKTGRSKPLKTGGIEWEYRTR